MMRRILYVGSFDPAHYGHLDTFKSIQNRYPGERITVAICKNDLKNAGLFALEDRKKIAEDLFRTDVIIANGYDEVRKTLQNANIIIRGIRNEEDMAYNDKLMNYYNLQSESQKLECIKVKKEFLEFSSTYIRDNLTGDCSLIKDMVTPLTLDMLRDKVIWKIK